MHGIPFVIGPKNEPIVLRRDIPHGSDNDAKNI
nr:hypothetical protein [Escherichia coli]